MVNFGSRVTWWQTFCLAYIWWWRYMCVLYATHCRSRSHTNAQWRRSNAHVQNHKNLMVVIDKVTAKAKKAEPHLYFWEVPVVPAWSPSLVPGCARYTWRPYFQVQCPENSPYWHSQRCWSAKIMMTSWHENTFCISDPLWETHRLLRFLDYTSTNLIRPYKYFVCIHRIPETPWTFLNSDVHFYNTRPAAQYHIPTIKLNSSKTRLKYRSGFIRFILVCFDRISYLFHLVNNET